MRVGPRHLVLHQLDVVVVAVRAQVDDVERAERRPAVLVRERQRDQAVALHLLGQREELVPCRRDLVALGLEDALVVEDDPRVVVERHQVVLAVQPLGQALRGVVEVAADLLPHVVDRAEQALRGEELQPVPGEPGGQRVRRALQVVADVVLERVVVDRVDADLHAGLAGGLLDQRRERVLGRRIGVVGAERDRPGRAAAAGRRGTGRVVVAARGQEGPGGGDAKALQCGAPAEPGVEGPDRVHHGAASRDEIRIRMCQ
jgi:hypothetical protein